MAHDLIQPESLHPTIGYSHASRVGDLLFVAGQVALDRDSRLVGEGDLEAQAHQVYRNLATVMEAAGGALENVVKMTTYLVETGHLERWRTVRNEYFADPMPPNTLCFISRLARAEFLLEVEAIATLSDPGGDAGTVNSEFYQRIEPFHEFAAEAMEPRFYHQLPESWWMLVADITESTRAVENGRYAEVNYTGAACIVAVNNALPGHQVPSVFGGDGATIAVPAELRETAIGALIATRDWSRDAFGLSLRVGAVPIAELVARGSPVRVAKLQFSPGNTMAMFRGAGFDLADALVKDASAGFRIDGPHGEAAPDLTSLSCRWAPMASSNGRILCLIIGAAHDLPSRESDDIHRAVLARIDDIVGLESEASSPVKLSRLRFAASREAFEKEVRTLRGPRWLRILRAAATLVAGRIVFRTGVTIGGFDPERYRREMTVNADFRKINGMLRLVLDCTERECDAIEKLLAELHARGKLHYGAHRTGHAVMTCVAPDPVASRHVHYIDGGDGGLWMAAADLKSRL